MKSSFFNRIRRIFFCLFFVLMTGAGCQQTSISAQPTVTSFPHSRIVTPTDTPDSITPTVGLVQIATMTPTLPAITATAISLPTPIDMPTLGNGVNMAYDSVRQEVVALGGFNMECRECSTTWVWNATTWQKVQLNAAPPGREHAGFAFDAERGNAILFGSQHDPLTNDTWVWDGQNWLEKHPAVSPPARWGVPGNILVYDAARKEVLLFGGMIYKDPQHSASANDTWLWDGQTWKQVQSEPVPPRPEISGVFMAYDEANQVVVLLDLDTTWIWNGKSWVKQAPAHQPFGTPDGAIGYDQLHRQTVLFGEDPSDGTFYTWIWDGKDWKKVETSQSQIEMPPKGPEFHMVYDTRDQKLVLFATSYLTMAAYSWTGDGWQNIFVYAPPSQNSKP